MKKLNKHTQKYLMRNPGDIEKMIQEKPHKPSTMIAQQNHFSAMNVERHLKNQYNLKNHKYAAHKDEPSMCEICSRMLKKTSCIERPCSIVP
jgi:hypothetical protein